MPYAIMKPLTDTDSLFAQLYCKTDIENAVTVRADKKPFGFIAVLFEHAVEPVLVPTLRTILELVFHLN